MVANNITSQSVETIPVANVKIEWGDNSRREAGDLTALKASIEDTGLQQPIGVQKTKGDSYRLIFGYRRFTCAQELGLTEIKAVVYGTKLKKSQRLLLNLQENVARASLSPLEEAEAAKRLLDEGMSEANIITALGWSKTLFTQRIKILGYSDALQTAIGEENITVQQASKIAELPEETQEQFIDIASTLTVGKLKELIDAELSSNSEPELVENEPDPVPLTEDEPETEAGDPPEAAIDPTVLVNEIVGHFRDLGVSELAEEDAAKMVTQSGSVEWGSLSTDDLEIVAGMLGTLSTQLAAVGAFEQSASGGDDEDEIVEE
jgi:ParB/RepB/Spo0J family partition protein